MKQFLLPFFLLFVSLADAQDSESEKFESEAILKGIAPADIPGYVRRRISESEKNQNNTPAPPSVLSPADCNQMGLENANFNGWTGYKGDNNNSLLPLANMNPGIFSSSAGINVSLADPAAFHTIMSTAAANDYCTNQPLVYHGNFSARLGNGVTGYTGQGLAYTFIPAGADSVYYFSFMAVLDTGTHFDPIHDQPYFMYRLYDATAGQLLDSVYAKSGDSILNNPGILPANCDSTYYYGWMTDTFDLSSRMGHTIEFEVVVANCIYGGHFGYAYIDFDCSGRAVGLNEAAKNDGRIFPNPSPGIFYCELPGGMNLDQTKIQITDISGRTVLPQISRTEQSLKIDFGSSAPGMYFLRADENGKIFSSKIVVE